MKLLVVSFLVILFTTSAYANKVQSPATIALVGGTQQLVAVLRGFVAAAPFDAQKEKRRVLAALQAVEAPSTRLTALRRKRIAAAILNAAEKTGVDPILLVAVARTESDLRSYHRVISKKCYEEDARTCGADCGITQHHISGPKRWVVRECRRLSRNDRATILRSAQELAYHIRWCQNNQERNAPLQRCVLNRYNSGTYYYTPRRCRRWAKKCRQACSREGEKCGQKCARDHWRCRSRSRYWVVVRCFYYGAQHGKRAQRNCRYAWNVNNIKSFYALSAASPRMQ